MLREMVTDADVFGIMQFSRYFLISKIIKYNVSSFKRYQLPDGFRRKDESRFVKRLFPYRKNFFNFLNFQNSPIITISFRISCSLRTSKTAAIKTECSLLLYLFTNKNKDIELLC